MLKTAVSVTSDSGYSCAVGKRQSCELWKEATKAMPEDGVSWLEEPTAASQ